MLCRPAQLEDSEACGLILHQAFKAIYQPLGVPTGFASLEKSVDVATKLIQTPSVCTSVATSSQEKIRAFNAVDNRSPYKGIGPLAVSPDAQGQGIGRQLMDYSLSDERLSSVEAFCLLQDSFNMGSLRLYTSLGFQVTESFVLMSGQPHSPIPTSSQIEVRLLMPSDLPACQILCNRILGFDRTEELAQYIYQNQALGVFHNHQLEGFASALSTFNSNFAVATGYLALYQLLGRAFEMTHHPVSFFVPAVNTDLLRWCLNMWFKPVKAMTYMVQGRPFIVNGVYLPSVTY